MIEMGRYGLIHKVALKLSGFDAFYYPVMIDCKAINVTRIAPTPKSVIP